MSGQSSETYLPLLLNLTMLNDDDNIGLFVLHSS